ncbi:MAG: bifunctional demethylmenaquinone methyltransferase/2-methoxy-6-polyprenyl-1,4-benzoquinol methylase UbiE [Bryobacterales bacterium]|nr:bifunctional demethylmenaquinone methyltransferase/2-methoxy-6-polyprenyl-1,4-benzoquinol methylase UbiE [Bryobacterales bacterium]
MPTGASPAGVRPGDEAAAAKNIREMFGRVAPRYDLLNRLLSARIDVYWRNRLVESIRDILARPDARVLDVCCGTGDVALALEKERAKAAGVRKPVLASDFCRPMLDGARGKLAKFHSPLFEGDAMQLPLPAGSVDAITVAYGFRNLANYRKGLEEFHRLLASGGRLAILEFSQPTVPLLGPLFDLYFRYVLPPIGNAVSGAGGAYSYLQKSVERFYTAEELGDEMRSVGFEPVTFRRLTGGISCLHVGSKP